MPTYTFYDKNENVEFDLLMTYEERQKFLKDNPSLELIAGAPKIVTTVRTEIKTDEGFKELRQKIADSHPNSKLHDDYGTKDIRDVKIRQARDKWRNSFLKSKS